MGEHTPEHILGRFEPSLTELEVIYHTAPVGLCVLDSELRYVRINNWLAAINGQPAEAHIGRTPQEMIPHLAPQVMPLYQHVLDTGEAVLDGEVKGETPAYPGVQRVFRDQYHPLHDSEGNVVGVNVVVVEITALKEEEEMRQASEARFRALANSMPQLVWTAGPDGTVDYYNERYREFAGIKPEHDGSWRWGPVVHPDDLERTVNAWEKAVQSGETYEIEHRIKLAGGTYRWHLSRGVPARDHAGRIVKWYGTATDVHDLRTAEEALVTSEEKFRTIFQLSAVGQAEVDPVTQRFRAVNQRMTDITGYSEAELLQMTFLDLTHPEERDADRQVFLEALAARAPELVCSKRYVRKDGSVRDVEVRSGLLYDREANATRALATFVDVTEQKEAEAERERLIVALDRESANLRELNETLEKRVQERTASLARAHQDMQKTRDLFYTLFHSSPMPIVLTRPESGQVLDANRAYLDFFGYRREDLISRSTLEMGMFRDPADRARVIERMLETGHAADIELVLRIASGEERTVLLSTNLVELGGEALALAAFLDVTPMVSAQAEIRHLASELSLAEERERRRIAQVLHDDVQQMLVALQMLLHMHGQEAAAETQEVLAEANDYLQETLETTRRLSGELSAPIYGNPAVKDGLLSLATFMEERYQLDVQVEAEEAGQIHDDDVRGLIMRLVRELLFNVVKHAGVTEARVAARHDGSALRIAVEDNGRGFDPEELNGGAAGSGFGLRSMDERLALIGGQLHVNAAPGRGTRVSVVVPVA